MVPVVYAIVAAVIAAISSAYTVHRTNKTAQKQINAANDAAKLDMVLLQDQTRELNDQAARDKLQRQLQTERERGKIRATQSAAGIEGVSALGILNNALMQETMDVGVLEANRSSGVSQYNAASAKVSANAQSRFNEAMSNSYDTLGASLMIGGNAANAGASGYRFGKATNGQKGA
jgi:hypothetical protein